MQICDYGCEQEAKHQFQNGKWCCSKSWNQCSSIRIKNSNSHIGRKLSVNHIKKISQSSKGKKNGMYDKIHSVRAKNKMRKFAIGKIKTKETRKKLSIAGKNRIVTKKTKNKLKISVKISISKLKKKYPIFAKVEEMRYEPGKEKEKVIQVHCKNHNCKNSKEQGGWFTLKNHNQLRYRIGQIERGNGGSYLYCSDECKQECPLYYSHGADPFKNKTNLYISEEYQTWRTTVLERENYICEYCDEKSTDVHHSRPQKLEPGFVLDPDFGVACCEKCHYKYGHKTGTECSTGNLANKICI